MGADNFDAHATGATMEEAFDRAVADAQYEYGHGGYTGTIAEKHGVLNLGRLPEGRTIDDLINVLELVDSLSDPAEPWVLLWLGKNIYEIAVTCYHDKWSSALGVELPTDGGPRQFAFFGYASS